GAAVLREQRDFILRRPKLPVCRFEHARDTQVHRRKSGKHDQANCGHLISPPAGYTPAFRMSQNAAYMTVSSSMTSLFGGRIHQPKATRDDGRHRQEQGAGRGFELRSCWSRARRFTSANIDPYACIVLLRE